MRNGQRARECATRACELTEWGEAGFLDTLAAELGGLGGEDERGEDQASAAGAAKRLAKAVLKAEEA